MTLVGTSAGVPRYDIVVQSGTGEECVYRTSRTLFDGGSEDVLSKGTRVWEALRVDPTSGATFGEPVALKDSWVGQHREREGSILARIRESAALLDEADRARLEGGIVTVVDHGDVVVGGENDCTRSTVWKNTKGFNRIRYGTYTPVVQAHYRAVYQEVCSPLCSEMSLVTAFTAVAEICTSMILVAALAVHAHTRVPTALSLLHRSGWFHGDISTNNILLHSGKAKLSDFECARKVGEVEEHDRVVSLQGPRLEDIDADVTSRAPGTSYRWKSGPTTTCSRATITETLALPGSGGAGRTPP